MTDSAGDESSHSQQDKADSRPGTDRNDPVESLPDPASVPAALRRTFWTIVLLLNIILLAAIVGVVFIFVGQVRVGLGAFSIAVGASALAYYRYRQYTQTRASP